MFAIVMLAALQAAAPVPPAPPAAPPGEQTIVRQIVIHRDGDAKVVDAPKGKEERREIIVIRDGKGSDASTADRKIRVVDIAPGTSGGPREFHIRREPGAAGERVAMLSCDKGAKVDSEATDKDGKKVRVMICASGGNQVEALERASKRIAENKDLPEDVRARVLSQMNAQIAQLKATK